MENPCLEIYVVLFPPSKRLRLPGTSRDADIRDGGADWRRGDLPLQMERPSRATIQILSRVALAVF